MNINDWTKLLRKNSIISENKSSDRILSIVLKFNDGTDTYWLLDMEDSVHFYMYYANTNKKPNPDEIRDSGWTYHIGQVKNKPYYDDVKKWLQGSNLKNGKSYDMNESVLIKKPIIENKKKLLLGRFNHNVKPKNGRHPKFKHLIYYEFEDHYGSYILTAPGTKEGDALISYDDLSQMFNKPQIENGFGYATDEYLELLS